MRPRKDSNYSRLAWANKTEVRSFLGLVNFYRWYIENCAQIKHSRDLRIKLTSPPVLGYQTRYGPFILEYDASAHAVGPVLSQMQNGREVVIAYGSSKLKKSQQNYCVTMREFLAVVFLYVHSNTTLWGDHFWYAQTTQA